MKKIVFILLCGLVLSACDKAPKCNAHKKDLSQTLTEWMQQSISDKYTITVTDVHTFYELKSSPSVLGTTLYEDFKDGRICDATANITIKNKNGKTFDGEVNVRFQYAATLPDGEDRSSYTVRMSGADVQDLKEKLSNTIFKEFRK